MEDLINSIKAHLYDRTTSPLIGAFVVSWSIWNYQFLLLFFSSLPADEKIDYISTFLYPCYYSYLLKGALYPLLTTIAFIFVYPYPAKFVYTFSRNRQKELKKVKQAIEDETPLTIEESRKIKNDFYALEDSYDKLLGKKEKEIENLTSTLAEKQAANESNLGVINNLREQLNEIQKTRDTKQLDDMTMLLKLLSDNNGKMMESELINDLGWPEMKYDFQLEELAKNKQIGKSGTAPNNYIHLSHEGKRHLMLKGLL